MSFQRQRRASWTVGVPQKRRQVADFQLGRRNTGTPETLTQSFSTPPSHTPSTPKSASSLTDIDETGTGEPQKFKFPYKRRATIAAIMSKSRSSPGVPGVLSPIPNGTPNGHVRTRHLSTGSSNQSDDPELSIGDITASSNFFDFDENADDLYMAPPEEYIHNMRIKEKIRGSLRKDSITAQPFTPLNVETIGGAYIEEEGSGGTGALKGGHSREGSKVSVLSSIPESVKSSHSSSKSLPVTAATSARPTPPGTPGSREILARDDKIAQLERELEELKAARWKAPPITDTLNRILLGQSYCLEWYKSMDQKRALLDAALDTFDGNCITTVLLFIRKTLNHQILMMMVKTRPSAVSHYCSFLKQLHAWKELTTVYQTLGDFESLGYLKLRECEEVDDADQRLKQLQGCQSMFSTTPTLKKNIQYVEEYIKLVRKQKQIVASETRGNAHIQIPIMFTPVTTTLLYCCKQHCTAPQTHTCNPEAFREMFKISEKQYFQVCLMAFTLRQNWTAIENLLTTKGVFGIGKKKKSPIGFERVVRTLGNPKLSRRPPSEILRKYLLAVDDLESRLSLATYTMVYDVGIETLKQMRDRERLRNYINQIPLKKQGEYRGKIRALLDNSQIKWKNH